VTGWRGIFAGALALIALESVLSSTASANRTAGAFTAAASLVQRALSPAIPLIPDIRGSASTPAAAAPAVSSSQTTKATTPPVPTIISV
jgi:hypothetical protein